MEDLYTELWGRKVELVHDFGVRVPQPKENLAPGYAVSLSEALGTGLPVLRFEQNFLHCNFQVLRVETLLPCGWNMILVRPEFRNLEHLCSQVWWEKWSACPGSTKWGAKLDIAIVAQPGTGKSYFLSYLLARRLAMGEPTVYREDDQKCYLFDEYTAGKEVNAEYLFRLPASEKERLWILTDDSITNRGWERQGNTWFIVFIARPAQMVLSESWRSNRNARIRYMTNWTWEEVFAAFHMGHGKPPSASEAERLYSIFAGFGPIARTCLQAISVSSEAHFLPDTKAYLRAIQDDINKFIQDGGCDEMDDLKLQAASAKLTIMQPLDEGYSGRLEIATKWIGFCIFERAREASQLNFYRLYQNLSRQRPLRTAAGWIFEGYCHDWFRKGGKFIAREIVGKEGTIVDFQFELLETECLSDHYFTDAQDLDRRVRASSGRGIQSAVLGKYFLPCGRNFESIDGLTFFRSDTLLLFQITIATTHEIKAHGIRVLLQSLPRTIKIIVLVFVIPSDRAKDYLKVQKVPSASELMEGGGGLEIRQFSLIFYDSAMRAMMGQMGKEAVR
ncbi:unnamed protein product [Tuber aestivum]|uniref:Uncharacterized protein n=1 Tax=Tuber aestivum TaxID=59557 RepID=A0A292PKT7_9PEZI|nr:unnamed protein product [Tuber aestivum]